MRRQNTRSGFGSSSSYNNYGYRSQNTYNQKRSKPLESQYDSLSMRQMVEEIAKMKKEEEEMMLYHQLKMEIQNLESEPMQYNNSKNANYEG